MTLHRRLSLAALVASLVQVGSGALVRATGSGDACPDWPRCFGRWVPPLRADTLIEYSHRAMASVVIALVIALAVHAIVRLRAERRLWIPAAGAAGVVLVQAALGAVVVASKSNGALPGAGLVTAHIAVAVAFVGLLAWSTVNASCLRRLAAGKTKRPPEPGVARLAVWASGATAALILAGAYVRGEGAGLAFADWPLMGGRAVPRLEGPAVAHFVHRSLAAVAGLLIVAFLVRALRSRPRDLAVTALASTAAALYAAQVLVGAAQVWTRLAVAPVVAHVVLSSLIWAALVAAVAVTRRLAACALPAETERVRRPVAERAKAYLALTKPRIVILLLVTTVPSMVLAQRGLPSVWLVLATLLGGTLAAGSANAINCYLDRDIDSVMGRTRRRPLPAHQVEPARALAFAVVLGVVAVAWMAATVNVLAAALTTGAILFYVFVYTIALKRTTPQNIVIGGAAGAVPVLVGWAAVTGRVGPEALVLFAIVFFWTPPHFWALAIRFTADYAAAGVPMLPVVAGPRVTHRRILAYSLVTVAVTLALYPVARMGAIYLAAAAVLGALFLRHAIALRRSGSLRAALGLFRYSTTYLALLFAAMGVDVFVHINT